MIFPPPGPLLSSANAHCLAEALSKSRELHHIGEPDQHKLPPANYCFYGLWASSVGAFVFLTRRIHRRDLRHGIPPPWVTTARRPALAAVHDPQAPWGYQGIEGGPPRGG
jgi:hypothetical protein